MLKEPFSLFYIVNWPDNWHKTVDGLNTDSDEVKNGLLRRATLQDKQLMTAQVKKTKHQHNNNIGYIRPF